MADVTQDQQRQGLQELLERLRDQGRLEAIPGSSTQVAQLLDLAHANLLRTRQLLEQSADDYDWQVATLWDAIIEGCKAAVASQRYRIKGGEGSHGDLTRAAAFILGPEDPAAAKALFDLAPAWLTLRNESKYDRHGVVSKATRDDILRQAGPVLSALSRVSHAAVRSARAYTDWDPVVEPTPPA